MAAGKKSSARDLRQEPPGDLRQQVDAARRELWDARIKARTGSLTQPHQIRVTRRRIARLLTVLQERERAGGSPT